MKKKDKIFPFIYTDLDTIIGFLGKLNRTLKIQS